VSSEAYEALTKAEKRALLVGQCRSDGKFSVARRSTLDNLVTLGFATRAMVDGPEGTEPSPAMFNGIITDAGRAALVDR
jgi:hypothetical protein